jgi:hypothetical protein
MSDIPYLVFDGGDALAHLRNTELSAPLHMRPEHDIASIKAWLRDRGGELTFDERTWIETAIYAIERAVGSIKTRQHAKAGAIGPRRDFSVVGDDVAAAIMRTADEMVGG